jgi:hypothetical protein
MPAQRYLAERRPPHARSSSTICVTAADQAFLQRPLVALVSRYLWLVLWRASDHSEHVRALVGCARTLSQELGWLNSHWPFPRLPSHGLLAT